MISRPARRAIIVCRCKNGILKSSTVCNHANLNTTFKTYKEEKAGIFKKRNPKPRILTVLYIFLSSHHCNVVDGFVRKKKLLSQPTFRWAAKQSPVENNVPICAVKCCQCRENPCSDSPDVSSVKAISCSQAHRDDGQ